MEQWSINGVTISQECWFWFIFVQLYEKKPWIEKQWTRNCLSKFSIIQMTWVDDLKPLRWRLPLNYWSILCFHKTYYLNFMIIHLNRGPVWISFRLKVKRSFSLNNISLIYNILSLILRTRNLTIFKMSNSVLNFI